MALPTDPPGDPRALERRARRALHHGAWLLEAQLRAAPARTAAVAAQQLFGALGSITAFYAILVFVRAAGNDNNVVIRGVDLGSPDSASTAAEFLGLFLVVVVGSAALLYNAERMATQIALELAGRLRRDLILQAASLPNRGWQLRVKGNPARRLYRVAVSDIRELSIAARMLLLLLAPATLFCVAAAVLILTSPLLVLILSPVGVLYGWWLTRTSRALHDLNLGLDATVRTTRSTFDDQARLALEHVGLGTDNTEDAIGLDAAGADDLAIHQRILSPLQMRSINQSLFALSTGVLVTVGLWRDTSVSDLILIIAALRFLVFAIDQGTGRIMAAVRRSTSILAYRELRAAIAPAAASDVSPTEEGDATADDGTPADLPADRGAGRSDAGTLDALPAAFLDKLPTGGRLLVVTNRKLNQTSVRSMLRAIDDHRVDDQPWLSSLITDPRLRQGGDADGPTVMAVRDDADLDLVDAATTLTVAFLRNPRALHRPEMRRRLPAFDAAVVVNRHGVQAAGTPRQLVNRPDTVTKRLGRQPAAPSSTAPSSAAPSSTDVP